MSKVRNLPETTLLSPSDLIYAIDVSEGPNAGRKATIATLKTAVIADAGEIPYDNTDSTLVATDVRSALDELDSKGNNHSVRHEPDGVDALSTAAPIDVDADGNNNIGSDNSYSRSDHKHNIATDTPVTLTPDQANAEGVSASLARADHVHTIAAAAPTITLSPAISNAEGTGTSFSRNDHTHAIATALVGNISSIQPDDAAGAGTADTFARGDHKHAIATDTVSNTGTTNDEGSSTSFARADHTHNTTISNSVASATADDTTASLTDVLIVSMTLTPAAGTYLTNFSTSGVNSGNGSSRMFISIYSDGVQVAHSEREYGISGGANVHMQTNAVVTVNGSQAIEVRWRAVAGTNTAHERSLTIIRLGD